jgi:hypothetical protein
VNSIEVFPLGHGREEWIETGHAGSEDLTNSWKAADSLVREVTADQIVAVATALMRTARPERGP